MRLRGRFRLRGERILRRCCVPGRKRSGLGWLLMIGLCRLLGVGRMSGDGVDWGSGLSRWGLRGAVGSGRSVLCELRRWELDEVEWGGFRLGLYERRDMVEHVVLHMLCEILEILGIGGAENVWRG